MLGSLGGVYPTRIAWLTFALVVAKIQRPVVRLSFQVCLPTNPAAVRRGGLRGAVGERDAVRRALVDEPRNECCSGQPEIVADWLGEHSLESVGIRRGLGRAVRARR